jgi:hypothetical protein
MQLRNSTTVYGTYSVYCCELFKKDTKFDRFLGYEIQVGHQEEVRGQF